MNLRTATAIALIAVGTGCATLSRADYVGTVHSPLPVECEVTVNTLTDNDHDRLISFAKCRGDHMLWVSERPGPGRSQSPIRWRIVSVTHIGKLGHGHSIRERSDGCVLAGAPEAFVAAVARWDDDQQKATNILSAWQYAPDTLGFVPISTGSVSCGHEEDRD